MKTAPSRSMSGNSELLSSKLHEGIQSNINMPGATSNREQSHINIDNIEEMVKHSSTKKIAELVDQHPEEAVSIIRSWMYSDK